MNIEIGENVIEIKFGMKFVRELDKLYSNRLGDDTMERLGFGAGVATGVPMIMSGDPKTLADFLYLGTNYMKSGRPTMDDIDDYIDSVDNIDGLYDEVVAELKNANACTKMATAAENEMIAQQKLLSAGQRRKSSTNKSS